MGKADPVRKIFLWRRKKLVSKKFLEALGSAIVEADYVKEQLLWRDGAKVDSVIPTQNVHR